MLLVKLTDILRIILFILTDIFRKALFILTHIFRKILLILTYLLRKALLILADLLCLLVFVVDLVEHILVPVVIGVVKLDLLVRLLKNQRVLVLEAGKRNFQLLLQSLICNFRKHGIVLQLRVLDCIVVVEHGTLIRITRHRNTVLILVVHRNLRGFRVTGVF